MKKSLLSIILTFLGLAAFAQGTITGDLMMNMNFFQSDPSIKANGNPLYDNYLSGSEGWLGLRYSNKGFTVFMRADAFNNSNLKSPAQGNTNFGLGAWSVNKEVKGLNITVGYIYDQIGSGILFRAYEDRGLLIDNALVGFELKYKLNDHIQLKGLTGQQKENDLANNQLNLSQRYAPIIRALNAEGDYSVGKAHFFPGIGVLNRTLDQTSMSSIISRISTFDSSRRFTPVYNMYAFTAYNSLTVGNFSWYIEGAYKTQEAFNNADGTLINKPGNVEYTTLGYAKKGIAINYTAKRTDDFVMRTSPNEILTNGMLNWQPIVARIRPGRLMSRYTPASQDVSELANCVDVLISPSDVMSYTFTATHINTLENVELYREGYAELNYTGWKSFGLQAGFQYMEYNRVKYQSAAAETPIVNAITPFAELTYKINSKKSLRMEVEYMHTKQDYGSWLYAILEYNIAPKFSISVADMYNIAPNSNPDNPNYEENTPIGAGKHYPSIYMAYTKGAHRFAIAYVKQVDGINCAGGVCRYEPAFSGVKATITSSF